MTNDDGKFRRELLDAHNEIARALREVSWSFRSASARSAAIEETVAHIREVSDAILAANERALRDG
jgi:hypothetical protein